MSCVSPTLDGGGQEVKFIHSLSTKLDSTLSYRYEAI